MRKITVMPGDLGTKMNIGTHIIVRTPKKPRRIEVKYIP